MEELLNDVMIDCSANEFSEYQEDKERSQLTTQPEHQPAGTASMERLRSEIPEHPALGLHPPCLEKEVLFYVTVTL